MSDNNKKIDILGDVMSAPEMDYHQEVEKLNKLISLISLEQEKPALEKQEKPVTEKKTIHRKQKVIKKKSTYYLTQKVFKELDGAKYLFNKILPQDSDVRITKSSIVNYALKWMLKELEEKGKDSNLIKQFLNHLEVKDDTNKGKK